MAKKKSKRFIVPSFHFLTTIPVEKTPDPETITQTPLPSAQPELKDTVEIKSAETSAEKSKPVSRIEVQKPKPLHLQTSERKKSALSLSSLKRDKEAEEKHRNKKETTVNQLNYKLSKNQRLLVELSLMKIASITFDGKKKI